MKRKNIFEMLYKKCSEELKHLVIDLKEYTKKFYMLLDLYQKGNFNSTLFKCVYLQEQYQTNEEIFFEAATNKNSLYNFIYKNEEFVKEIILTCEKYKSLIKYIRQKIE